MKLMTANKRDSKMWTSGLLRLIVAIGLLTLCALASAATITDSRGEQHFERVPQRVVALNWSIAESLIELGVTPVGVADVADYREWVVRPALPEGVVDVGSRSEPNIERIASLQPDVIILSNAQAGLIERFEQVAPVVFFDAFRRDHDNVEAAREIFLSLGRLFERETLAQQKLAALDARLEELRQKLGAHFGEPRPPVSSLRFINTALVLVYGDNSLPQYTLRRLGFEPALPQPPTQWGFVQKKISELGQVEKGILLHFEPFAEADKLFASPLWRAMPAVRAQRFAAVEPSWTYGGAMSVGYLAEAMTRALLGIEPD